MQVEGRTGLGNKLKNLSVGSRVGLVIDSVRRLHLLINGRDVTTVLDMPSPCFAFFELNWKYRQVCNQIIPVL